MLLRTILPLAVVVCGVPLASLSPKKVPAKPDTPADVNFSEHVAPILLSRCASCHRPGQGAPFSLLTYADARKRGKVLQKVTESRFMPPWHVAPGHGEFVGEECRLSDEQIAAIKRWVEADMPEGDPAKLPAQPKFPDGWHLGAPDMIVSMDKAYEVPASGRDIYRNFVLPLNLARDEWVTAIEMKPSAPTVVHHTLFFHDTSGAARQLEKLGGGQPGFFGVGLQFSGALTGWAAGTVPHHWPLGLGTALPRGSDLIVSTHFHPSGKVEREKSTIGLYFARKKPERTLVTFSVPKLFGVMNGLNIPPGEKAYKLRGTFKAPVDIELISVLGHAHFLCESMKSRAVLPDGTTRPLFFIPRWDFSWQINYLYKQSVKLPKGTIIQADIIFNNSSDNPANPFNPPRRVRWGLTTTEEMGSVIFRCIAANEQETPILKKAIKDASFGLGVDG